MAIFQGENLSFKIVFKDETGTIIPANTIDEIDAVLYLETNNRPYVTYAYPTAVAPVRDIVKENDDSGFLFELAGVDSATLPVGRYIIQMTYTVTSSAFPLDSNKKISTQKGPLISILKAV